MKHWLIGMALALGSMPAAAETVYMYFGLNGLNEVNPITHQLGAGDPDAYAWAQISVTQETNDVGWRIWFDGLGDLTAAHIHAGVFGVNGPVWLPLDLPAGLSGSGYAEGVQHNVAGAWSALTSTPLAFYLNIHTNEFPGGAVRNQLIPVPEPETYAMLGAGLGMLMLARKRRKPRSPGGLHAA